MSIEIDGIAKRIADAIGQPFFIDPYTVRISCSMGATVYPEDGQEADALLNSADAAMYQAKRQGKNYFQF